MNSTARTIATPAAPARTDLLGDLAVLAKVRIVVMELICVVVGFLLAAPSGWSPLVLIGTLLGTGLVAASASALNQVLERDLDARMVRTRDRPLPAGRMTVAQASVFAISAGIAGTAILAVSAPPLATVLGVLCWMVYVVIYTPLKTISTLNTAVGAVSGALPILLGWVAAGGALDATAWGLFGVLVLWQYPHFMAIAWICRDDYRAAGYRMASTVDDTGAHAGWLAIVGALALLPTAILPIASAATALGAALYVAVATLLTLVYLRVSIDFRKAPSDSSSRRLLRASLLYLPLWLASLMLLAL